MTLVILTWWLRQRVTRTGPWTTTLTFVYALALVGLTYDAIRPYVDSQGWMIGASLLSVAFLVFGALTRVWPKENAGPKPPLAAVMSDEAIRAKVADYLEKSNALETWWRRPITAEQLQAELDRMAKNTRDGGTLQELYRALGNDPVVIAVMRADGVRPDELARVLGIPVCRVSSHSGRPRQGEET